MSIPVTRTRHAHLMLALEAIDRVLALAAARRKRNATERMERTLANRLRALFRAERTMLLREMAAIETAWPVSEAERPPALDRLLDAAIGRALEAMFDDFADAVQAAAEAAYRAGVTTQQRALGDLTGDVTFGMDNPRAIAYLTDHGAARVTGIQDTTRQQIRDIIIRAVAEDRSYQQAAKDIRGLYSGFARPQAQRHIRDRAELIAVAEIGDGFEAGTRDLMQTVADAGIALEHAWLTVGDDRVSEGCAENEAAGWLPLGDAFPSGHDRPLRHPACRCTAVYRRAPDA